MRGSKWYALYVRSHHEKCVSAQLESKHFDVFLPLSVSRRKWADRWKTLDLPLFPGYVFCQFDPLKRAAVLATSGVIDMVRFGNELAPIREDEIEAIRLVVSSSLDTEPYAGLVEGQRVMIIDGPLRGVAGTLIEIRKKLRFVVSVDLLQRSVLVEIEREWAVPCGPNRFAFEATALNSSARS